MFPVTQTWESSLTFVDDAPVDRSSVPLPDVLKVFSTQVVRLSTGTGSGTSSGPPKLQPAAVQSGSVLLAAGAVDVAVTLQMEPVWLCAHRVVDTSGVEPSGVADPPPPMLSPPQVRFCRCALAPSLVSPQTPVGDPLVKSRMVGDATSVVVVVVDTSVVVVGPS